MKISPKVKRFQQGGPMEDPNAAPMEGGAEQMPEQGAMPEQGGDDPLMQIAQMAMGALQSGNCDAAMEVCNAFVQLLQQAQGGGAPQQQEPVFRRGGKLITRIH